MRKDYRRDSNRGNMLNRRAVCQIVAMVVATELTENEISEAFKAGMPCSKAGWDSTVTDGSIFLQK